MLPIIILFFLLSDPCTIIDDDPDIQLTEEEFNRKCELACGGW